MPSCRVLVHISMGRNHCTFNKEIKIKGRKLKEGTQQNWTIKTTKTMSHPTTTGQASPTGHAESAKSHHSTVFVPQPSHQSYKLASIIKHRHLDLDQNEPQKNDHMSNPTGNDLVVTDREHTVGQHDPIPPSPGLELPSDCSQKYQPGSTQEQR